MYNNFLNIGFYSYIFQDLCLDYCRVKILPQKEVAKKLAEKVAALRKKKNLSQADLCYEADIDISTLSRLERGKLNVTFSTLYSISKVLEVEMKDLYDFK